VAAVVELLLLPRARLPPPPLLPLPSPPLPPPRRPRQLHAHWPLWPCLHRLRPQLHPRRLWRWPSTPVSGRGAAIVES